MSQSWVLPCFFFLRGDPNVLEFLSVALASFSKVCLKTTPPPPPKKKKKKENVVPCPFHKITQKMRNKRRPEKITEPRPNGASPPSPSPPTPLPPRTSRGGGRHQRRGGAEACSRGHLLDDHPGGCKPESRRGVKPKSRFRRGEQRHKP